MVGGIGRIDFREDADRLLGVRQDGGLGNVVAGFPNRFGFTMISSVSKGRPRQFLLIWLNILCSILFHFEVPGGK